MSQEDIRDLNDDNYNLNEPRDRGIGIPPLQPDIGLGLNENRRINQDTSGNNSVLYSHYLGRGGTSNSGLPDFVQDHLPLENNSNIRQLQSRPPCDNSNLTLPDFLSDTHRNSEPIPSSSNNDSENSQLLAVNTSLRREIESLRRRINDQHNLILRLENDLRQPFDANGRYDPSIRVLSPEESQSLINSLQQEVSTLQDEKLNLTQENISLQEQIDILNNENQLLKQNNENSVASASQSSSRLTQQIRNHTELSENLIRDLLTSVTNLKQLASRVVEEEQINFNQDINRESGDE